MTNINKAKKIIIDFNEEELMALHDALSNRKEIFKERLMELSDKDIGFKNFLHLDNVLEKVRKHQDRFD